MFQPLLTVVISVAILYLDRMILSYWKTLVRKFYVVIIDVILGFFIVDPSCLSSFYFF